MTILNLDGFSRLMNDRVYPLTMFDTGFSRETKDECLNANGIAKYRPGFIYGRTAEAVFTDYLFWVAPYASVIVAKIKELYGTTPLEQDFNEYKERGNWICKVMPVLNTATKQRKSPMLVWRTLNDAIAGWCVEEYRVYMSFHPLRGLININEMTWGEIQEAIRRGDMVISHDNFRDDSMEVRYVSAGGMFHNGKFRRD